MEAADLDALYCCEMSRVKLDSVRAEFDPNFEAVGAGVDTKIGKNLKAKTKYKSGSGLVSTDLEGENWKVGYDFVKKTAYGQLERKFEKVDVKVKQRVPDMKWSVIPSPEVQIETTLIEGTDFSDSLELKYDMNSRVASVEEKFKIGKKHECVVQADSRDKLEGASVKWKTKVGSPYAKTVSAKYSKKKGPILEYAVDPTDRLSLKLESKLNTKVVEGELVYKPEKAENAELGIKFQQPLNSGEKPRTGFFVKWKFD